MTAGSGILHEEYHEEGFARRGGPMQMAQIWVNLPEHKWTLPATRRSRPTRSAS